MGIDLVTLAEYKAYVGITSTTSDAIITAIIPKVSALVKNICRRTFVDYVNDSKTEVYSGGDRLYFKETPLLTLGSLEYSSDYGATYTELVEYTDFVLDLENNSIAPIGAEFYKAINGYKLTYTSGYEELPVDLKLAVLDLVTYYIKNDMAIHSPKAPGTNSVQIEYVVTTNLPAHIKRVLDLYTESYD
jgi:hypothetical protein